MMGESREEDQAEPIKPHWKSRESKDTKFLGTTGNFEGCRPYDLY